MAEPKFAEDKRDRAENSNGQALKERHLRDKLAIMSLRGREGPRKPLPDSAADIRLLRDEGTGV